MELLTSGKVKVFFAVVLIALIIVGLYLFVFQRNTLSSLRMLISATILSPGSTDKNIPNILYPYNPDLSGRNIYYNSPGLINSFPGVGMFKYKADTKFINDNGQVTMEINGDIDMIRYIVGSYVEWENIPNSNDKYLILSDLLKTKNEQGQEVVYPKIRIGFGNSEEVQKNGNFTVMGVEDITSIIPVLKDKKNGVKNYKIGLIGDVSTQDINILIKDKDTIVLVIAPDIKNKINQKDDRGNMIASWLFIRRYNPVETLPKELNKQILLQSYD